MRDIKFKAWHKQLKKMFSAEEMAADQLTMLPTGKFINVHTIPALSRINYDMIPLQFTAMKDKNGVEIYEGDILRITDPYGEDSWIDDVEFRCGVFQIEVRHDEFDITAVGWADEYSLEVIGNIFEHPSLLTPSPVTEEK
jgi:uncharacterized phage protein (TIGR01671 family)